LTRSSYKCQLILTTFLGNFYNRQIMNTILKLAIVGVSATAIATLAASAQAVTLINGNFNPVDGRTVSSFFSDGGVSGWTVGEDGNSGKLAFVAPIGGPAPTELNALARSRSAGIWVLRGDTPIPSPDGIAQWFVAVDGDPTYSTPISQTVTGLTAGQKYDVTFYQAAGQQVGLDNGTTEQWAVNLGATVLSTSNYSTAGKLSALMSPVQPFGPGLDTFDSNRKQLTGGTATNVSPWQKQTLTFTADAASTTLSFLAVGTPSGRPPFSLLAGLAVTPTSVPEPFTIIGTIVGSTAAFRLRKKLTKSTKNV
jgi:hypothetical protein